METIYNGFFDRIFYQKAPPPPSHLHPRVAGSKKKPGVNRNLQLNFVHIWNSNKGYQKMIISQPNESVICFGSFLIIQELNKTLWLLYKIFKYQFFSILAIETWRQKLIVKV